MTFDDQLHRTFDTLTDRLHADIRREVQVAIEALAAAEAAREADLARDIETARGAAAADLEEMRANAARDISAAREALARDVDAAVAASVAREAESVKAAREEARAEAMREADALHAEHARVSGAAAAERLLDGVRSIGRARSLSETLDTLVSCASREAERAAVLRVRHGSLHGWRFVGFGPLDARTADAAAFDDGGLSERARESNAIAQDDHACAIPLALAGDVVAVLYAEIDSSNPESRTPSHAALEILCRHAARSLEALVAFKAARAMSVPSGSVPPERSVPAERSVPDASSPSHLAPDSDEVAARRYARLLVSEIRLYHEPDVVAGRRDRDLLSRLGGEIARARALYEQRIPPNVRQYSAYFDEELVRTLADGDPTLLELRT